MTCILRMLRNAIRHRSIQAEFDWQITPYFFKPAAKNSFGQFVAPFQGAGLQIGRYSVGTEDRTGNRPVPATSQCVAVFGAVPDRFGRYKPVLGEENRVVCEKKKEQQQDLIFPSFLPPFSDLWAINNHRFLLLLLNLQWREQHWGWLKWDKLSQWWKKSILSSLMCCWWF